MATGNVGEDTIAELTVIDQGNGFLRIVGEVVNESGDVKSIDYNQLPKFMLGAVFDAARKAGALT